MWYKIKTNTLLLNTFGLKRSFFSIFIWSISALAPNAIQVWESFNVQVLETGGKIFSEHLQILNYFGRNEKYKKYSNLNKITFLQFSYKFYNSWIFVVAEICLINNGQSRQILMFKPQFSTKNLSILIQAEKTSLKFYSFIFSKFFIFKNLEHIGRWLYKT